MRTRPFFKKVDQTNVSNLAVYIIKFTWFSKFDQISFMVYQWR